MSLEIYWISGSPYSWRALLALELKKLSYTSRLLTASKGEHKSPDYLKLNPRGKVPTLKDGDTVVCESLAILQYLDRKHPEPPLFGRNAQEAAKIMQSVSETASYFEPGMLQIAGALFFGGLDKNLEQVQTALKTIAQEFQTVNARLGDSPWLVNGQCSAADIALFPMVQILQRALSKPEAAGLKSDLLPLHERFPAIARWMSAVETLPGYERTYPPHWR
ncbi:MAG: glutathione S-transferase family protein [Nevskiales bacterium]